MAAMTRDAPFLGAPFLTIGFRCPTILTRKRGKDILHSYEAEKMGRF